MSRYLSTPFQSGKGMSSSSNVSHKRRDAYKYSIFSRLMASPPPIGNIALYFLLLNFLFLSVSTIMPSYIILHVGLSEPQFWPEIWLWCITVFLGSTMLSKMPLSSVLFCVSGISTRNKTDSLSSVLGSSLALFWIHHLQIELISQNSTD